MSALTSAIQHRVVSLSQHSKQRTGNKKHTDGKIRNKTVPIWRWPDGLCTKSQGIYKNMNEIKTKQNKLKFKNNNEKSAKAIQWKTAFSSNRVGAIRYWREKKKYLNLSLTPHIKFNSKHIKN